MVAADCVSIQSVDGVMQTGAGQEIFPVIGPGRTLACALQGITTVSESGSRPLVLDLKAAVRESIGRLADRDSLHDLHWYASKLSAPVHGELVEAARDLGGFALPRVMNHDPGLIFQVLLCGYYRNTAADLIIQFRHQDGRILPPQLVNFLRITPVAMFGSVKAADRLFNQEDGRFAQLRSAASQPRKQKALTLCEGAGIAESYVRACMAEQRKNSNGHGEIQDGGDIQIAEITRNGFRWRRPQQCDEARV